MAEYYILFVFFLFLECHLIRDHIMELNHTMLHVCKWAIYEKGCPKSGPSLSRKCMVWKTAYF